MRCLVQEAAILVIMMNVLFHKVEKVLDRVQEANHFRKRNIRSVENEKRLEIVVSKHNLSQVIQAMLTAHPYEEVAYDILTLENVNSYEGSGMFGELNEPIPALTFLSQIKESFKLVQFDILTC